jgi:TonB family protein
MTAAQTEPKSKESESLRKKYTTAVQDVQRLQQELERLRRELEATGQGRPGVRDDAPASDFFLAGNAYVNLKKYPEAVAAFSRALQRAPQDAVSWRHRGIAYSYLGEYTQALSDFSKALELDPQDAVAYNQRGITYYAMNNLPQALSNFDKAIELQPKLAEAYNNRGIVLRTQGHYQKASKDFDAATQLGMTLATEHLQVLREEIRQVQERLRQAGLNPGPADGLPGQQTTTALQQYQRAQGLAVTGLFDAETKRALGLQPAATAAPVQDAGPRFVHQPKPEYPVLARQQGWEGTVTLRLELLTDGTVGEVQVARSSGHAVLDNAAQEAARTWRHEAGKPDAGPHWVDMHLTFTLEAAEKQP